MNWVTSDNHWYHKNILKYANRPFINTHEMDETMFERWNSVVKPGDTVYHLGDIAFANKKKLVALRERLNGKIFIVRGNHDRGANSLMDCGFIVIPRGYYKIDGIKFRLTHNYDSKPQKRYLWTLSGHYHGEYPHEEYACVDYRQKNINVGVDFHEYYPISMNRVKEIIRGDIT